MECKVLSTRGSSATSHKMADVRKISLLLAAFAFFQSHFVEMAILSENITNNGLQSHQDFLVAINEEEHFESCLLYGDPGQNEVLNIYLRVIVEHFKKPVMILNDKTTNEAIANRFNRNMLIIAELGNYETVLPKLAATLERMRQKRLILISDEHLTHDAAEKYLQRVFHYCEAQKLLNAIVIFEDFAKTKRFHSYNIFPSFVLEAKTFGANGVAIFPQRMQDLKGFAIRTVPDQMFPWSYMYMRDGQMKVGGYIQMILATYAQYKNATLTYPIPVELDDLTISERISELMLSDQLDIPASLKFLEKSANFEEASQPFGVGGMFVMAPVKWYYSFWNFLVLYVDWRQLTFPLLSYTMFIMLFYFGRRLQFKRAARKFNKTFLATLLEPNYMSSNFAVVQSRNMQSLVTLRLITCLSAIYTVCLTTHFSANLNTFLTKPAMMPSPQSWLDFEKNGQKVLFSNLFYNYVRIFCGEPCANIEGSLVVADISEMVREYKLGFNTSYAHPVDLLNWYFVQLQMRKLKVPIFRLTDINLRRQVFYCFFLQRNSIFKESLDLYLTRIVDHGLQNYWIEATYMETVRYGVMHNLIFSDSVSEHPLDLEFMSCLWPFFGIACTLATCVFAVEYVSGRWRM